MSNPFSAEVIDAIAGHMNRDHADDTLVICRGAGNQPAATSAIMDSFDGDGADYIANVDGQPVKIRINWSQPLTKRAQVRPEIVRLFHDSRTTLGLSA